MLHSLGLNYKMMIIDLVVLHYCTMGHQLFQFRHFPEKTQLKPPFEHDSLYFMMTYRQTKSQLPLGCFLPMGSLCRSIKPFLWTILWR